MKFYIYLMQDMGEKQGTWEDKNVMWSPREQKVRTGHRKCDQASSVMM